MIRGLEIKPLIYDNNVRFFIIVRHLENGKHIIDISSFTYHVSES